MEISLKHRWERTVVKANITDLRFGDLSDEITGITVICEYTLWPVDICSFCRPSSLTLRCQNL
jgi:hypothetical protein